MIMVDTRAIWGKLAWNLWQRRVSFAAASDRCPRIDLMPCRVWLPDSQGWIMALP